MRRLLRSSSSSSADGRLRLADGGRVAVVGGGPAGSLFAAYFLDFAAMAGLRCRVEIFEPRDYGTCGPRSCNMCGGIISETLVQSLAVDGIPLPGRVVQRGIDSYVLHMDGRRVGIRTPDGERRIGTVHRGAGPRDLAAPLWRSFDGHLLEQATDRGARVHRERVAEARRRDDGRPVLRTRQGEHGPYDLLAVATGVNAPTRLLDGLGLDYRPPRSVRTVIREYRLGADAVEEHLGASMHVFLLDLPGLDFAAFIPKGEYATLCLLGARIDKELLGAFLDSPEVRSCLPRDFDPEAFACHCAPSMAVTAARAAPADRILFVGDCGVSRLYKDGIGAAYRTAKAAARTAVFRGVGAADLAAGYDPFCRTIDRDNRVGRLLFAVTERIQHSRLARAAVLRAVEAEQSRPDDPGRLSRVLWDMFTGSADYRDILRRAVHPAFLIGMGASLLRSVPGWIRSPAVDPTAPTEE